MGAVRGVWGSPGSVTCLVVLMDHALYVAYDVPPDRIEERIEAIQMMLNERQADQVPFDRRTKPTRNRRPLTAGDAAPPEQS